MTDKQMDQELENRGVYADCVEELPQAKPLVDYLMYCSYRHNRLMSPRVKPEYWEPIFGKQTAKLELRFQLERSHES
jgi:hypothetical protein